MKKLYRSNQDRKIAGICGGLGEYFGVDPTIFRIIFVIAALPGGVPGILLYVVLWWLIPADPTRFRPHRG